MNLTERALLLGMTAVLAALPASIAAKAACVPAGTKCRAAQCDVCEKTCKPLKITLQRSNKSKMVTGAATRVILVRTAMADRTFGPYPMKTNPREAWKAEYANDLCIDFSVLKAVKVEVSAHTPIYEGEIEVTYKAQTEFVVTFVAKDK